MLRKDTNEEEIDEGTCIPNNNNIERRGKDGQGNYRARRPWTYTWM